MSSPTGSRLGTRQPDTTSPCDHALQSETLPGRLARDLAPDPHPRGALMTWRPGYKRRDRLNLGPRGWNLRGASWDRLRAERHPLWKGTGASRATKYNRALRWFRMGPCERCGAPGMDRHHRDGNPGNNVRSNIWILCRRCHMDVDGRLHRARPGACVVCARVVLHRTRARCHSCDVYFHRTGRERPYLNQDGRLRPARRARKAVGDLFG